MKNTDESINDPILKALLNGEALPEKDRQRLLQQPSTELTDEFEHLLAKATATRKLFANTRQLEFVLMKTIPDQQTSEQLANSRMAIGWAQLATEMVDFIDFFRKKKHLNPKEAPKLLCITIGMAALTITSLGLGGSLLLDIATAVRGLTGALKSLIRQIENERNLNKCSIALSSIKRQLADLFSMNAGMDPAAQMQLMANCLRMQKKHDELKKMVHSNTKNALERVTQFANLCIVVGAIMLCFPATTPIGAWLLIVGNAVKFALGASSLPPRFPAFKKCFLSARDDRQGSEEVKPASA